MLITPAFKIYLACSVAASLIAIVLLVRERQSIILLCRGQLMDGFS